MPEPRESSRSLDPARLLRALPTLVAILLSVLVLAAMWPGGMSWDSLHMLQQVRTGITDSTHSILMIGIWRVLERVYPGPALVLLLHALVFFLSLAHLLRLYTPRPLLVALILPAIALTPVLGPVLVVWKDVGMMAFFTAACAAMAHAEARPGRRPIALAFVFLMMATAYRHDAPAPALPLFLWWSWLAARTSSAGPRSAWARVAAIFVLVNALSLAANWALDRSAGPRSTAWMSAATLDVIGTSHYAGVNLMPEEMYAHHASFEQADIAEIYNVDCVNHAIFPTWLNAEWKRVELPSTDTMAGAWISAVTSHPASYLRHRLEFALNFTAATRDGVYYPSHLGVDENTLGVVFAPVAHTGWLRQWVIDSAASWWWKPWIYYALGALLAAGLLATRTQGRHVPLLILASGYTHLFAAVMVMPCADMRYQLWSMASAIQASIISAMLMARPGGPRIEARPSPERKPE